MLCRIGLGSALVIALVSFVGCGESNPPAPGGGTTPTPTGKAAAAKRFIFLINTSDPFWSTCEAGLKEGEKVLGLKDAGLSITMESNDGTAQGQIDKLRQYGSQSDIVGVAISVLEADNSAIQEEMIKLQKKGLQVITVDGDVNLKIEGARKSRKFYIGTNNLIAGQVLGKATRELLLARKFESGGFVQFAGKIDNDNARLRMDGFKEGVGAGYEEIDRMPDGPNPNKAQDNVRNAIINHKEKLNCLVGIWAYNGPAIAVVVNQRKERDKFVCVTFDAAVDALSAMDEGKLDCLCVQNPFDMGYQAVRLLKAMHEKDATTVTEMFPQPDEPDGDIYTTGLRIVVPSVDSPVKQEMFDPKVVEFMTLPQMKEWLAKFNLTSS